MKKILIYLFFLPLFSCDDFLTVESENDVTYYSYFKTEQDVESIITTMMAQEIALWGPTMEAYVGEFDVAALPCDDYHDEDKRNLALSAFPVAGGRSWSTYYTLIGHADMLLDNSFRFEGITRERKEFWLGQANFIKALCYFEIARVWGDAPIVPNSEYAEQLGKSPVKEVLEKAIECAEKALILPTHDKLVDSQGKALTSKQYASLGTVKTLLANIYAWMGGLYGEKTYWEKAEQYASDVIGGECGVYRLEPTIDLLLSRTLGKERTSDETIFGIEVSSKDFDYTGIRWLECLYPGILLCTYPEFDARPDQVEYGFPKYINARISVETVENMFPEEEDARRDLYWYNLGTQELDTITHEISSWAYFYKWHDVIRSTIKGNEGEVQNVEGNRVIWRLADLKLLRAECRARLKMPTATEDLDDVRERAGLDKYTGSTDSEVLRREIFNERERELFGEGQRYYDIVRNGYLDCLSKAYQDLTEKDIANGALYMPVSERAFKNNELMTQNKYWLWRR
jgi:hypothetical protein